jgi:ornithine carbamoyltransferase
LADAHGGSVTVGDDPAVAVKDADAVYTAAWPEPLDEAFRVSTAMVRDAVFMHPLPARRGQEVTTAVIEGRRSVVREQAANYLPATQAALATVLA